MLLGRLIFRHSSARLISCVTYANLIDNKSSIRYSPFCGSYCVLQTTVWLQFIRVSSKFLSSVTKIDNQEFCKELNISKVTDLEMGIASIEKLCKTGNVSDAVHLLRELTNKKAHISVSIYNSLLYTAMEANNFSSFSEVFKCLLTSTSPPNSSSYRSVAMALQSVPDSELLNFIRDLCEITKDKEPTVMNQIIFVLANSGQLDKAILVFRELKKMNINLDLVTFNTVLGILGKAGFVDQMLSELEAMKSLGVSPDAITYNIIISSLRRLGQFKMCKDFAREMSEKGIEMDLRTYTALIDSLGRAGLIKDALSLFEEMKRSQRPSVYVYRALISNLRKAGKFELALKMSDEMELNFSVQRGVRNNK